MTNKYKPYSLDKGVSLKVLENQMVIFEDEVRWMYTTIIKVRENMEGVKIGKIMATDTPVIFNGLTHTWSVTH